MDKKIAVGAIVILVIFILLAVTNADSFTGKNKKAAKSKPKPKSDRGGDNVVDELIRDVELINA